MKIRVLLASSLALTTSPVLAADCPRALDNAKRLLVVTTSSMDTLRGSLQLYERPAQGVWTRSGEAFPVVVGKAGLAWGHGFTDYARKGEPVKAEGDKRTPAGIFPIGDTFGFAPASYPGHLVLKPRETVCVDDPQSPNYNRILNRADAGKIATAEDMPAVPYYRHGIVVDYATDRARRAGSCIFLHVWRSSQSGTTGCVAMPEAQVQRLQSWTRDNAALVVLPAAALDRLSACLPGVAGKPVTERKAHSPR
jgi:L,D-peptidoglycan transpeptidase YkuD (ErfK/YbiS/YcfS/YnhG family)